MMLYKVTWVKDTEKFLLDRTDKDTVYKLFFAESIEEARKKAETISESKIYSLVQICTAEEVKRVVEML